MHVPRPLDELPRDVARRISVIATDVDGTLTVAGVLSVEVLRVLTDLAKLGVEVIPASGRPAGEVTGLCRWLPGVRRGIAENGALEVAPDQHPRTVCAVAPGDRERVLAVAARLDTELGLGLQPTTDMPYRLVDVAYERHGRDSATLVQLGNAALACGVHVVWSDVHIHFASSIPDKGAALLNLLAREGSDPLSVATIGDAPNDAGLFRSGRFGATIGTADVAGQLAFFPEAPDFIAREAGGLAFVALARAILASRD